MEDERSRDEKQKRSDGVDSLERNGLATFTEIHKGRTPFPFVIAKVLYQFHFEQLIHQFILARSLNIHLTIILFLQP